MAKITTAKRFHRRQLFELLGGDLADLSVTPKVVGTETRTRTEVDEEGNETEVEYEVDVLEGVPLDSEAEKEITVTVRGDGVTPITQEELEALVADYAYDPDYGKSAEDKLLEAFDKNPNPTLQQTIAAVKALRRRGGPRA